MKFIDNASGNISICINLTNDTKADKYKISWTCNSIGSGKSYIRIYATLVDGYKTYFMPIQFLGTTEFEFNIDSTSTFLQFDVIGDSTIKCITFESVVDATMEYVKLNSTYWDRIKEITSDTGKVRTEMLEGLINMTTNAFSNESGTITQENGVMTWLNGSTVEDSTQAVQITGGAIRIANTKNSDGTWNWTTAINGSGINAATIIAETFAALNITGVTITGGTITGGTINGVSINGGSIIVGEDVEGGTYTEITTDGVIKGYYMGKKTIHIDHASEGRIFVGEDIDSGSGAYMELTPGIGIQGGGTGVGINGRNTLAIVLDADRIVLQGDVYYTGKLEKLT